LFAIALRGAARTLSETSKGAEMADVGLVALTVAAFVVLILLLRGAERL